VPAAAFGELGADSSGRILETAFSILVPVVRSRKADVATVSLGIVSRRYAIFMSFS
jgi:hypothetical protein